MIGYFIKSGDEEVSDLFTPYVWRESGFETLFKNLIGEKNYGSDLSLLLIKFYVEGKFSINGPDQPVVSNYSKRNKDIAVEVRVRPSFFHNKGDKERKKFIVSAVTNAIDLVKEKLSQKKLDIDFEHLKEDVLTVAERYVNS